VHTITSGTEAEAVAHLQARGALVQARAPLLRMSSLHDLEHRRPLEIEETLGYVVTQAVTMGLTVPTVGHVLPPHAWPQSMHAAREWVTMLALWSRGNLSLSAVY
jgi:hypothetical protein